MGFTYIKCSGLSHPNVHHVADVFTRSRHSEDGEGALHQNEMVARKAPSDSLWSVDHLRARFEARDTKLSNANPSVVRSHHKCTSHRSVYYRALVRPRVCRTQSSTYVIWVVYICPPLTTDDLTLSYRLVSQIGLHSDTDNIQYYKASVQVSDNRESLYRSDHWR